MLSNPRWTFKAKVVLIAAVLFLSGGLLNQVFAQSSVLNDGEINGLHRALDDEYHAWAVYDQVIQDFGEVRPFINIRKAEQNHIDAVIRLFDFYGIEIPDNSWIDNVSRFSTLQEACAAAVEAELVNRDLYTDLFATTNRDNILRVYENLQRASEDNHLPAFERCAR